MANPKEPDGTSWANHQHVIMAINIKSMNDFEPADGATSAFYGSNTPFKITGPVESVQQISIRGTNVKKYGDIKPGTPILLLTRVRDIEPDKLTNLDKRYIVCSNAAFDAITATITATITPEYDDWKGLPVLINNAMKNKINIFERQNKDNSRLKDLIKNARDSISRVYASPQAIVEQVKPAIVPPVAPKPAIVPPVAPKPAIVPPVAPKPAIVTPNQRKPVDNPPDYKIGFNSAYEYFQNAEYKAWAKKQTNLKWSEFNAKVENYFLKRKIRGGSPNADLTGLSNLVANNDNGFKKYVYFLLTQPFYFKLNALTPTMLTKIKTYILSGTNISPNTSFDQHILQPFTNFAYVEYIVKIPPDGDLSKDGDLIKNLSELIPHSISTNTVSHFASQIKKDTNNYKQLTNSAPTNYYIHVFRFIELIEKQIEHTKTQENKSAESTLPEHVTVFIGYALNKIYEHMQQVTPIFDLLSSAENILIQDNLKSQQQKRLKVYIDDYVSSQNRTDIITYLKINSTEPEGLSGNKPWNQRYDIRLKQSSIASEAHQKFNAMIVGYKMYPAPFYKQVTYGNDKKKTIVAVDGLEGIVTYKTSAIGGVNEIEQVKKYDKYYLFGNYENIFPLYNINSRQKETNLDNATRMTAIIKQICTDNKPVFLLGYGASGSGKTSSLIYFNKGATEDAKNGIVIHLCKKIIEKLSTTDTDKIGSVKLVVKEFYETTGPQTNTSADYIFDVNLKKPSSKPDEPKHAYHVNMNEPVANFETMGQVLKQLVDVDRYVKATPNNPQSSRSHVLVFIQFCSDDKGETPIRHLIIGDFAGKENEFQCADTDTVVAFLNKKVENKEIVEILNKKLADDPLKPETYTFYGAQLIEQSGGDVYANDPIDKLVTDVDDETLTQVELDNRRILKSSSGMLFDFEKPSNSINIADINNPETYDSFKLIADQYAPIVIKYYFKDEATSVQRLNNSKIYHKLLNDKDKFDIVDNGIDIFNIYTKAAINDDKRVRFLQHLIFEDLFEADHISNVITDANINNYKYGYITNAKSVEVSLTDKDLLALSQNLLIVPGNPDPPTYNIGKKMYQILADLYKNHGVLIDNSFYTGPSHITSEKRDAVFSSVIRMINTYKTQISTNVKSGVNQNPPYTPAYFTLNRLQKSFIDVFDKTTTEWIIALNKTVSYTDHLERDREKAIPIVKSFTINTMCEYFMTNRFKSLLPFFEKKQSNRPINSKQQSKKPTETLPIIYYDKSGHKHVNEFKYILDSLNAPDNDLNRYIKLIDIYKKNITISQVRLKHGQQVCENRLIEGKYINSSLDKIREAIKYILNKKHENSDALFHSPDFIDMCLQSYCPSGINCFNTSSTDNAPESLIDEIYNQMYPNESNAVNGYTKDQFYKDLVISVFGVFNVSRLADNPPPVPYIDINHLKHIYYNNDNEYSEKYPLLWALHELKEQIKKLPEQQINMLPLIEYISEEEQGKKLPLINALTELIDVAIIDYTEHNVDDDILSKARKDISSYFMNTLKDIIEAIDIHNAASTIGTLEFLDQLAKFNSVNNLCYKNTEDNATPYLDDNDYKNYVTNAEPIKKA